MSYTLPPPTSTIPYTGIVVPSRLPSIVVTPTAIISSAHVQPAIPPIEAATIVEPAATEGVRSTHRPPDRAHTSHSTMAVRTPKAITRAPTDRAPKATILVPIVHAPKATTQAAVVHVHRATTQAAVVHALRVAVRATDQEHLAALQAPVVHVLRAVAQAAEVLMPRDTDNHLFRS